MWSNGEPFDYDGWINGEPNGGTGENCVEQVEYLGVNNDRFNDLPCTATLTSVCELTPAGS